MIWFQPRKIEERDGRRERLKYGTRAQKRQPAKGAEKGWEERFLDWGK